jgi:hypothetical protein
MPPAALDVLKRTGCSINLNAHWKERCLPAQAVEI